MPRAGRGRMATESVMVFGLAAFAFQTRQLAFECGELRVEQYECVRDGGGLHVMARQSIILGLLRVCVWGGRT